MWRYLPAPAKKKYQAIFFDSRVILPDWRRSPRLSAARKKEKEAPPGFEPGMVDLQSPYRCFIDIRPLFNRYTVGTFDSCYEPGKDVKLNQLATLAATVADAEKGQLPGCG